MDGRGRVAAARRAIAGPALLAGVTTVGVLIVVATSDVSSVKLEFDGPYDAGPRVSAAPPTLPPFDTIELEPVPQEGSRGGAQRGGSGSDAPATRPAIVRSIDAATGERVETFEVTDAEQVLDALRDAPITLIERTRLYGALVGGPISEAGSVTRVEVAGIGGVPRFAPGAILVVAAVDPTEPGFLTVFPCDPRVPEASNVNYVMDEAVSRTVLAPLDDDGDVCVYTYARSGLVVEVIGYVNPGTELAAVPPRRLFDSRRDRGPVADGDVVEIRAVGVHNVPADAIGVFLNVTVDRPSADGYLSVFTCGRPVPERSDLVFEAGQTVPEPIAVRVDDAGDICVAVNVTSHVIVDLNGYVRPAGAS